MAQYQQQPRRDPLSLVEEGTFDFTLGDHTAAVAKLRQALEVDPDFFPAWHALTEVYFAERKLDEALEAAEKAHTLKPDDPHINTSLSRIWVERGDKAKAEHYGAQARMMSWKQELSQPGDSQGDLT
jgi:cytochrome c-type biogenesis protein CcmH/NrfG